MELKIGKNTYFDEDVCYSKVHYWVRLVGGIAFLGISDFAQAQLGENSMIELIPSELPGTLVSQTKFDGIEPLSNYSSDVTHESAKTIVEQYSPINREVELVNTALATNPEIVNRNLYGVGWPIIFNLTDFQDDTMKLWNVNQHSVFITSL
jgi:glycine cleavage system H protein